MPRMGRTLAIALDALIRVLKLVVFVGARRGPRREDGRRGDEVG